MIEEIYEKFDLQLNNLWDFYFTDFPDIKYRCQSVTIPFLALTAETHSSGAKYYNGYTPEGAISATFLETTDNTTYRFFRGWMDSVYDQNKRIFLSGPGKRKDAVVALQSTRFKPGTNYESELIYSLAFKLNNCLITDISGLTLAYGQSDVFTFDISFMADFVKEIRTSEVK